MNTTVNRFVKPFASQNIDGVATDIASPDIFMLIRDTLQKAVAKQVEDMAFRHKYQERRDAMAEAVLRGKKTRSAGW